MSISLYFSLSTISSNCFCNSLAMSGRGKFSKFVLLILFSPKRRTFNFSNKEEFKRATIHLLEIDKPFGMKKLALFNVRR